MSKKTYDLDSKDFFWAKNAQHPFPQVAEEIDIELNKCVAFRITRKGKRDWIEIDESRETGTNKMRMRLLDQLELATSMILLNCTSPHYPPVFFYMHLEEN